MSQPLECPRCHRQDETRGSGWQSRSCRHCGAPLVLASGPVETLVRSYLYRDRPAPIGVEPPRGRKG
ncbi:MAG TPA: hypothetical protein VFU16_13045 [Solirubrobacterales bacterium]|nr:hypothetical protein [Solirubrobacterales bacterium]